MSSARTTDRGTSGIVLAAQVSGRARVGGGAGARLATPVRSWFRPEDCRLDDFRAVVEQTTDPADYPHADVGRAERPRLRRRGCASASATAERREVQAELARALIDGPGHRRVQGRVPDPAVVDRATAVFDGDDRGAEGGRRRRRRPLRQAGRQRPGLGRAGQARAARRRRCSPTTTPTTCSRWSARPGSAPATRSPRRSTSSTPAGRRRSRTATTTSASCPSSRRGRYPAHVHRLSPALTLQGAVAHCDMPVETGPTMYLPHSQKYPAGLPRLPPAGVHRRTSTSTTCSCRCDKGDAAFFNPALFHGAGTNRSADVRRMANLLQVSSAFGRAMETVDRAAIVPGALPGAAAAEGRRRRATRPAQRRRGVRRGLRVPDQPRPRPAGRRAGPADPGRAGLAGAGGGLGPRDVHRPARCPHRPARDGPGLTGAPGRGSRSGRGSRVGGQVGSRG